MRRSGHPPLARKPLIADRAARSVLYSVFPWSQAIRCPRPLEDKYWRTAEPSPSRAGLAPGAASLVGVHPVGYSVKINWAEVHHDRIFAAKRDRLLLALGHAEIDNSTVLCGHGVGSVTDYLGSGPADFCGCYEIHFFSAFNAAATARRTYSLTGHPVFSCWAFNAAAISGVMRMLRNVSLIALCHTGVTALLTRTVGPVLHCW